MIQVNEEKAQGVEIHHQMIQVMIDGQVTDRKREIVVASRIGEREAKKVLLAAGVRVNQRTILDFSS